MRVEHYDPDTQIMSVLEDDIPSRNATPEAQLAYWEMQYEFLKNAYASMPRSKQRQQVALARDEAQKQRNHFRGVIRGRG